MNWLTYAPAVVATCSVIGLFVNIASRLMSIQKTQDKAFLDISTQLNSKLNIADHIKICEKRDDELKLELQSIRRILEEQDSRSLKIEKSHEEFRHQTANDFHGLKTDIAVMKATQTTKRKTT